MSTPMRRTRSPCCARAASGHEAAAPAMVVMNSRRLMAFPSHVEDHILLHRRRNAALCVTAKLARQTTLWVKTGKARTEQMFSGLAPIADVSEQCRHLRVVATSRHSRDSG